MVLVGTFQIIGNVYTMRVDITSNNKIWHCLKGDKTYEARSYSFEESDIAFAIVDEFGKSTKVFGDQKLADLFTNLVLRATSLTNDEDTTQVFSEFNEIGQIIVRQASNNRMNARLEYNEKSEISGMSVMEDSTYYIELKHVSSRVRVSHNLFKFSIDKAEDISILSDGYKGMSIAISFPSKQEMMDKFPLQWAYDYDTGELIKDYKIVNLEDLKTLSIMVLPFIKVLSSDWETTGLNMCSLTESNKVKDRPVGLGLSWRLDQAIYIPFEHTEVPNVDLKEAMTLLKPFLETVPGVGANILFDMKVFYELGINVNYVEDVLLLWYNMDPTRAKFIPGLKDIVEYYGIKQPSLSEIAKGAERYVKYFPAHLIHVYCCADADHTLFAFDKCSKDVKSTAIKGYKQDVHVARLLSYDEYYGVNFDVDFLHEAIRCAEQDRKRIEDLMFSYVGQYIVLKSFKLDCQAQGLSEEEIEQGIAKLIKTEKYKNAKYMFSPSKDAEMRKIFFSIFGMKPIKFTKKDNQPAVDKDTVRQLLEKKAKNVDIENCWIKTTMHQSIAVAYNETSKETILLDKKEFASKEFPIVYLYSAWKLSYSELTKFFYPLRDMSMDTDGVVYLSFRLKNTDTYRITHRLQTLKGVLKRLVIAPDEYYVCGFDAAAIEIRNIVGQSKDATMREILSHPERDSHRETASLAFSKPPETITSKERKNVKAVIFGSIYGISAYGLCIRSYQLRPTKENLEFADNMINLIKNTLPNEFAFLEASAQFALEKGFSINPDNRARYYDRTKQSASRIWRQALNFPVQSHAAGIFRQIYLALKDCLKKEGIYNLVRTFLLVHDELQNYAHQSIHPFYMCWIIFNHCILHIENHPPYFVGAGFGSTWYEAKNDRNELPVLYLEQKAKEWEEGKWKDHQLKASEVGEFVYKDMQQYMFNRYMDDMKENGIDFKNIDLDSLVKSVRNYYILGRLEHFVEIGYKENEFNLEIQQVRLLLVIAYKLKLDKFNFSDGTSLLVKELLDKCITKINSDVLKDLGEEVKLETKEESDYLDLEFDEELDDMVSEELIDENDDNDESEGLFHSDRIMGMLDLMEDDGDSSSDDYVQEYVTDDDLYEANLDLVDSNAESMAERYACKGISKRPLGYIEENARKYKTVGRVVMIQLDEHNFKEVIQYISSNVTNRTDIGYSVTFILPDGSPKEFQHYVSIDWDKLDLLLDKKIYA